MLVVDTYTIRSKHRADKTDEVVEFIEVQTGTYFGEDDIVRIEDDYGIIYLEMKDEKLNIKLSESDEWDWARNQVKPIGVRILHYR